MLPKNPGKFLFCYGSSRVPAGRFGIFGFYFLSNYQQKIVLTSDPLYFLLWKWVLVCLTVSQTCKLDRPSYPGVIQAISIYMANNTNDHTKLQLVLLQSPNKYCTQKVSLNLPSHYSNSLSLLLSRIMLTTLTPPCFRACFMVYLRVRGYFSQTEKNLQLL